ncbi:hypothetical protein JAAARDRAFT_216175 [Jaapia argillacea MUCL 33604]|uniref:Uncharacterized protein n=1 Tax=Jaapia argillacea MUCL 33604 TaxID=933084 RepID=A0A067QAW5_9AGAM|nr:hypothetical protein JAAARDRAFT_216175 [Jaapia argillacea MUCL 33604]
MILVTWTWSICWVIVFLARTSEGLPLLLSFAIYKSGSLLLPRPGYPNALHVYMTPLNYNVDRHRLHYAIAAASEGACNSVNHGNLNVLEERKAQLRRAPGHKN